MKSDDGTLKTIARHIAAVASGQVVAPISARPGLDADVAEVVAAVNLLVANFKVLREFSIALANGRVDFEVPPRMHLLDSLKSLQSSLKHLTWQTQEVAAGDYEQRVDFLGDFSTAFNQMVHALQEKERAEREAMALVQQRSTELLIARDAAEAASRAKSVFLASVSHEIRTPLNGVLGMAQVLLTQGDDDPVQRDGLKTILGSGHTLMALLNDVLDMSKIEAGKLDITPIDGDLLDVIQSVHKLFCPRAEEKGIGLDLEIAPGLPPALKFDPTRVRQCVANLVSNAVKFTSIGRVRIRVEHRAAEGGDALISIAVSDSGIGITEEARGRLFTEFSQANASTARHFGGTGLGLAITRKLVKMMGGNVTVASTHGEGSTFTLVFRAQAATQTPLIITPVEAAADHSQHLPQGLRLLLVDDNAINRKVARMMLSPEGMAITEAANGREALDLLAQHPFDLVLLDVHMPVMDGMEAIAHIRASSEPWHSVPVIALTADAMSGDEARLLAAGMDGYTSKPIDQNAMINEIHRVLKLGSKTSRAPRAGAFAAAQ